MQPLPQGMTILKTLVCKKDGLLDHLKITNITPRIRYPHLMWVQLKLIVTSKRHKTTLLMATAIILNGDDYGMIIR